MRKKFYYVKFEKIVEPKTIRYRGVLVEAKCERSALFIVKTNYGLHNDNNFNITKCKEISKEVYDRLENLGNIRRKKQRENNKGRKNPFIDFMAIAAKISSMNDNRY